MINKEQRRLWGEGGRGGGGGQEHDVVHVLNNFLERNAENAGIKEPKIYILTGKGGQ